MAEDSKQPQTLSNGNCTVPAGTRCYGVVDGMPTAAVSSHLLLCGRR